MQWYSGYISQCKASDLGLIKPESTGPTCPVLKKLPFWNPEITVKFVLGCKWQEATLEWEESTFWVLRLIGSEVQLLLV